MVQVLHLLAFCFVFCVADAKIDGTPATLSDLFPVEIPVVILQQSQRGPQHSFAHLNSAIEKFGYAVLELRETYPIRKPTNDREKYYDSFLADLTSDDSLPCVYNNTESFCDAFQEHVVAMDSFSKLTEFFVKEFEDLAPKKANGSKMNLMFGRFMGLFVKNVASLKQLSTQVNRLESLGKHADVSKANLPVSLRCRFVETRHEVVTKLHQQAEDLTGLVTLVEDMIDLLRVITQFADETAESNHGAKLAELSQRLKSFTSKPAFDNEDPAKALPTYF